MGCGTWDMGLGIWDLSLGTEDIRERTEDKDRGRGQRITDTEDSGQRTPRTADCGLRTEDRQKRAAKVVLLNLEYENDEMNTCNCVVKIKKEQEGIKDKCS